MPFSKQNLTLRQLQAQPCREGQCWSPAGWQDQSSAGAPHCQAALGLSGLQHVRLERVGIFREKELGNTSESQLRGNTERWLMCACVMHVCYFRRTLICLSPKAHDNAETLLLSSVSPYPNWESFIQSQTPQMCLYSWLKGAKRVGQPKHI